MIIFDDTDGGLFAAIAKGVINEDFGNLVRIHTLGNAQHSTALQVVDVRNCSAIAAAGFSDLFGYLSRICRTVNYMIVIGGHGASNIVY